ncbi:hypothetical protein EAN97_00815 [Klebsiella pneumoniae]|nr:hypothetical protein EAN97_00815 [Klebsiella pneumoniae]RRE79469.1 hypothetical protein EAO19_30400 [Klebsiella pneumoniae]
MPGMLFHAALWSTGSESCCRCYHGDKTQFAAGTSHERLLTFNSFFSLSYRGLTLSGTKTHVKQRFLPLTPLLMVSDDLWSPVLPA